MRLYKGTEFFPKTHSSKSVTKSVISLNDIALADGDIVTMKQHRKKQNNSPDGNLVRTLTCTALTYGAATVRLLFEIIWGPECSMLLEFLSQAFFMALSAIYRRRKERPPNDHKK